jgi:hypothetical protein
MIKTLFPGERLPGTGEVNKIAHHVSALYSETGNSSKGHKGEIAGNRLSIRFMLNSGGPSQRLRFLRKSP